MAIYNEVLVGRFNRALQKLTGIKGSVPSPQLSGEIIPSFPFPLGAEFRYLDSWDLFFSRFFQSAVAGQNGQARLRNPAGSNVLAVLESVLVGPNGAAADNPTIIWEAETADLPTAASNGSQIDPRTQRSSSMHGSTTTTAAPITTNTYAQLGLANANTGVQLIVSDTQEIPLLPGFAITLQSGTVNQAFICHLRWRERYLEEGERA